MLHILDANDNIVSSSKNLAGVRRFAGMHITESIHLQECTDNCSSLHVKFYGGYTFFCWFISFDVLKQWIVNRRSMYGANVYINSAFVGKLSRKLFD